MTVAYPSVSSPQLRRIVGDVHVSAPAPARLEPWDGAGPSVIVAPGNAQEIADVLRAASEEGMAVVPAGGFTHQADDEPIDASLELDLRRLKSVEHYDPGDLTIGVGAGMTLAEVDALIAPHRQMLPIEVADPEHATIGGALAVAAQGPLRHAYGAIRDHCIGIHFVTGDGTCAKGGGRVVKNVAGYDLMKLLIGSRGTLGVITSASFKLFPRPQQTRTFVCALAELSDAIALRDRIVGSALAPMCLELVSPHAHEFLREHREARDPDHLAPEEIRGAPAPHWSLLVRAGGSDAVLARYRAELGSAVTHDVEESQERDLWRWMARFTDALAERHRNVMVMEVAAPSAAVRAMLDAAEHAALDYNFISAAIGCAAMGTFTIGFIPLSIDPPPANYYASAASAFRALLPRGVVASVMRCPREARAHFQLWSEPTADLILMREVKRALDPAGILNPGRFLV